MLDGRKRNHARIAAAVTATALTTIGLGAFTPAAAAPNDIASVQDRVDRLSDRAEAAAKRHGAAKATLTQNRRHLARLRAEIDRHQLLLDTLRAQVASSVSSDAVSAAGASTPVKDLSRRTDVLLSNVTLATEAAGASALALADSNVRLAELNQSRSAVRARVDVQAGREKALRQKQEAHDARVASAAAELRRLEAKAAAARARAAAARARAAAERMARIGGPAVAYAKSKIGNSYVYGATGPSSFDCSGLTMMAWSQAGVSLPRTSSAQYNSGPRVSESELQPGDLVFYYSPVSHVGIYIGDGQIVNALNPGSGVQISGLHDMPYVGAVRPG